MSEAPGRDWLRRLTLACALVVLALVGAGGLVRATGSGLGCLDEWPTCRGGWIAPASYHAVIEFTHRVVAAAAVLMIGLQAALAARFRARRFVRRASWAAALVVVAQAALGAVVVKRDLHATLVTAHYLLALLLVALTTGAAAATWVAERGSLHVPTGSRRLARMSAGACGATLLVLVVGAYVREKGAGLAFRDWPLMSGRLIPPLSASPSSAMFLHRALAALVLGHVIATVMVARKDGRPGIALCAWTALGCYVGQIALGAANVWTRLAPASVLGHVLLGSLVWAALVCLLVLARARPDVPARLAPRETLAAERA